MNFKEAIKMIDHYFRGDGSFDKLRNFLESQQAEITTSNEWKKTALLKIGDLKAEIERLKFACKEMKTERDRLSGAIWEVAKTDEYKRLKGRIYDLESVFMRDCDVCKGSGSVSVRIMCEDTMDKCPHCNGTGKVPRWLLPEWFVIMLGELSDAIKTYYDCSLLNEDGDEVSWGKMDKLNVLIFDFSYAGYVIKLTKLPDSDMWEVEVAE